MLAICVSKSIIDLFSGEFFVVICVVGVFIG